MKPGGKKDLKKRSKARVKRDVKIANRKRTEGVLWESEERYRLLFENSLIGIGLASREGKVISANKAMQEITGYSEDELKKINLADTYENPQERKKLLDELKRRGNVINCRARLKHKDGTSYDTLLNISQVQIGGEEHLQTICIDITERKETEDDLRKSEATYRRLFESSQEGIAILDANTQRIIDANPYLQSMSGRSLEQLLGKQLWEIESFKDFGNHNDFKELRRRKSIRVEPFSIEVKEKESISVEIISTFYAVNGREVIQCNIHDITELMSLQQELERNVKHLEELVEERTRVLRESEETYRTLMITSPDAVIAYDLEGTVTDVSDRTLELHGFSNAEELLGRNTLDLIAPEDHERATINLQRTAKEQIIRNIEYTMLRKDGTRFPAELNTAVIKDAEGKPKAFIATVSDITERKRMNEAIDLARQYAENIVSTVRDPMVVLDSNLRIVSVNRSFYEHFKVNPTETEGKSLYEVGDRQWDNPELRRLLEEILPEKSVINDFELIHVFPTIGQRAMLLNARRVLTEQGGKPFILLAIEDITERKRLDELRNRFISAVTHELRTPLISVKGYVDYILSGKLGSVAEKVDSSLKVVQRNTDVLLQLVNDLLDVQRLERQRLDLNMEPVNLRKLLEECIENRKYLIEQSEHSLKLEVSEDELTVVADRIRLRQVLMNIIENAAKFTPKGGQITIRVDADEEQVKVQISDTGIGIRKEDLERVFVPFAAIEKPTYFKGTGLGMSLGKGLIEAHGGRMLAESAGEGKGATFIFTLPRKKGVD